MECNHSIQALTLKLGEWRLIESHKKDVITHPCPDLNEPPRKSGNWYSITYIVYLGVIT